MPLPGSAQARCVDASGPEIQRLLRLQFRKFRMDLGTRDAHSFPHRSWMSNSLFHAFDAAQATAGATRQIALALQYPREALAGDVEVNRQSVAVPDQLDAANLVRSADDSFAQREADAEILQIRRRGQHHDVRQTVIVKGNRTFLRDVVGGELDSAALLALHADFAQGRQFSGRRSGRLRSD